MRYSQFNPGCVNQSTFSISYSFGKLLENILDILNHDVKQCD
jgi:hypothetical protein